MLSYAPREVNLSATFLSSRKLKIVEETFRIGNRDIQISLRLCYCLCMSFAKNEVVRIHLCQDQQKPLLAGKFFSDVVRSPFYSLDTYSFIFLAFGGNN